MFSGNNFGNTVHLQTRVPVGYTRSGTQSKQKKKPNPSSSGLDGSSPDSLLKNHWEHQINVHGRNRTPERPSALCTVPGFSWSHVKLSSIVLWAVQHGLGLSVMLQQLLTHCYARITHHECRTCTAYKSVNVDRSTLWGRSANWKV